MNQNIVKQSGAKLEDSQTTSLSSLGSPASTHYTLARDLYHNVIKQLKKNEDKLNRVFTSNINFNFQLYRPKLVSFWHLRDNLNAELLEKQLDRLMEDQCKLDKQLSKINFQIQEDEELKQLETYNRMDHFSLLHTIWNRSSIPTKTDEKIDQINCKVAAIKNHIRVLATKENYIESTQLQKYVHDSTEYQQIKQKLEQVTRQMQTKQLEYMTNVESLCSKIQSLTYQNEKLKTRFNDQSEKSKRREEEMLRIMQKYQQIELQILKKQKQLKKSKQNHQEAWALESVCKRIKFTNKTDGLSIYIFSQSLETDVNLHTSKTLNEMKNYLAAPNALANLVEGKLINIPISLDHLKGELFDKVHFRPSSKRKSTIDRDIERPDQSRSQIMLGSQDKKKRFERSRLLE